MIRRQPREIFVVRKSLFVLKLKFHKFLIGINHWTLVSYIGASSIDFAMVPDEFRETKINGLQPTATTQPRWRDSKQRCCPRCCGLLWWFIQNLLKCRLGYALLSKLSWTGRPRFAIRRTARTKRLYLNTVLDIFLKSSYLPTKQWSPLTKSATVTE